MSQILAFGIIGLVIGAGYAIAASGLVVTYSTSNVFNIAHGAVGMVMAFGYWELHFHHHVPAWLALILIVGVAAPLFGFVIERTMMRRLTDAPVAVSLVVTVALLVGLIGAAQYIWPPAGRPFDEFFLGHGIRVGGKGGVFLTAHQMITFGVGLLVAGGLYLLLNRTRTGIAMRAVVDNRELLALHGGRPNLLSGLSWALGSSLAALAGILLAPTVGLGYIELTLLVISAYAAAMVGRLKNLPRTFIGAIGLGLLTSYAQYAVQYVPRSVDDQLGGLVLGVRIALPTIFLFAAMLLLPQERLRVGRLSGTTLPPLPSWARSLGWGAGFFVVVYALTGMLSEANNSRFGQALCLSLIMLSLVVLTGYGGDVSLCQMSFVGVGGLVIGRTFGGLSPLSLLGAFVITGALGALVAIPALRLRGLYLGLGTLAVAAGLDSMVFQTKIFGFGAFGGSVLINRPTFLGYSLKSERAFTLAVALAFVLMALVVLAFRRGKYGRILLAARDSEAACATLGFNTTAVRVLVFSLSAGLAGVAGAFYAGMRVSLSNADVQFFQSLPLLLFAVVGGVTCVTGALIGGLVYGMLPVLQSQFPALGGLVFVGLLVAVVGLGGDPNGVASMLFGLRRRWQRQPAAPPAVLASGGRTPSSAVLRTEEGAFVGTP
ncbi:MAG: ABC transporter permease [Actinomycetota bacterium]|nr:ABC transporter permease [Actinomycetota bacterium]